VQAAGDARAQVDVFADGLDLGRVGEVAGADGLAHHVVVLSTGDQNELLLLHDVF